MRTASPYPGAASSSQHHLSRRGGGRLEIIGTVAGGRDLNDGDVVRQGYEPDIAGTSAVHAWLPRPRKETVPSKRYIGTR